MNLCTFERVLPPSPPLAGRWKNYRCDDCHAVTRLELRVYRLPGVGRLVRQGWLEVHCRTCGRTALRFESLVVS